MAVMDFVSFFPVASDCGRTIPEWIRVASTVRGSSDSRIKLNTLPQAIVHAQFIDY